MRGSFFFFFAHNLPGAVEQVAVLLSSHERWGAELKFQIASNFMEISCFLFAFNFSGNSLTCSVRNSSLFRKKYTVHNFILSLSVTHFGTEIYFDCSRSIVNCIGQDDLEDFGSQFMYELLHVSLSRKHKRYRNS